jgi:hypothetical protein
VNSVLNKFSWAAGMGWLGSAIWECHISEAGVGLLAPAAPFTKSLDACGVCRRDTGTTTTPQTVGLVCRASPKSTSATKRPSPYLSNRCLLGHL